MREQRQNIMIDMSEEHMRLLSTHSEYIEKVKKGQTPFRDLVHCFSSLVSPKLNLKLTEQEQALKQTCLTFFKDMSNFEAYCKQWLQRAVQVEYSYIEPPVYVKNHPVLMALWDKQMELYTNPLFKSDVPNYLPKHAPNDDGRAFMEERIRKEVDKYDEEFARLWNQDKSKLIANKKQIEIDFYNFSTRILEEYSALEDKSKPELQQVPIFLSKFKKLPKRPKRKQQTYARITIDQLTKMLLLNKKDNRKYNLDFFAKYFAMEAPEHKKQLFDMLNSISYLRVFVPEENNQNGTKEVKQEVLKFVG